LKAREIESSVGISTNQVYERRRLSNRFRWFTSEFFNQCDSYDL